MAETFPQLKKVLGGIVDRPMAAKLVDLSKLSAKHRTNPGYPLVAAMVASLARHNHLDAEKNLVKTGKLLNLIQNKELARPSLTGRTSATARLSSKDRAESLELAFATHLHQAVTLEFEMLHARPIVRGRFKVSQVKRKASRVEEARDALERLRKVAKAFEGSTFAATLHAGVSALSQAHPTVGKHYKSAVAALRRLSSRGDCRDLAGFFLVYAYRRAHDYDRALRVAKGMERRNPNSSMLQQMIGSCYGYDGNHAKAVASYKKAVSLGKRDPATHLGLAIAAQRAGNVELAAEEMKVARRLDKKLQLKIPLAAVTQNQRVLERMPSRTF